MLNGVLGVSDDAFAAECLLPVLAAENDVAGKNSVDFVTTKSCNRKEKIYHSNLPSITVFHIDINRPNVHRCVMVVVLSAEELKFGSTNVLNFEGHM